MVSFGAGFSKNKTKFKKYVTKTKQRNKEIKAIKLEHTKKSQKL